MIVRNCLLDRFLVSLIEIAFDASLRCSLEIFRHELHLGNLGIVRDLLVDFRKRLYKFRFELRFGQAVELCLMVVRVDERYQCAVVFDHE